jgi:putative FmdB family regulatory protein
MPLYDYRCAACGGVTEIRHAAGETFAGACPACGSTALQRVFNPAPIHFKGSGFYATDSKKNVEPAKAEPAKSDSGASEAKPDPGKVKAGEAKPKDEKPTPPSGKSAA